MKTITKLKIQRYLNRRSNGVVEQIERILAKLQAWINKLDAEQDKANEAMKLELAAQKSAAQAEIQRMEKELADRKAEQAQEATAIEAEFTKIIEESAAEAHRARAVRQNFEALTTIPE